jgi:nitroreductase
MLQAMDPLLELMAGHRSVRALLPTPVPDDAVRAAVIAARQAATSSWVQAYSPL